MFFLLLFTKLYLVVLFLGSASDFDDSNPSFSCCWWPCCLAPEHSSPKIMFLKDGKKYRVSLERIISSVHGKYNCITVKNLNDSDFIR